MSLRNRYFLSLIFIAFSSAAFGQAASTPFSSFGMGIPYGNALIQNQGMGGIGVSQPQYWSINNLNPALLVFNRNTTFQAGALLEARTIKSDTISQKGVYGNLNYLVVAFPVIRSKKSPEVMIWSTSAGLMPFTNVKYKLAYADYIHENSPGNPVVDTMAVVEQGSGGLNQFYWSNGVRLHKDISVGLKATYIFGSVTNDYSNYFPGDFTQDPPIPFIVGVKEQTYVKDFLFSGGLSFSRDSIGRKNNYRLSAGLVYSFGADLRASKTTVVQRRDAGNNAITSDTLVTDRGSVIIPPSYTLGVSISKGIQWSAGIEFSAQDWTKFESINQEDIQGLGKAWRVAAGGEFTPDVFSNNYFKRITYRTGFSYEISPITVNNNELKDLGINFGFSFPTGASSIDLGARIGKRGDKLLNGLEESYYKIYFGITFNDRWFIRRRFD